MIPTLHLISQLKLQVQSSMKQLKYTFVLVLTHVMLTSRFAAL
jgi:hypothetical protein